MTSKPHIYNRGTLAWLYSHILRNKYYFFAFILFAILAQFFSALIPVYIGRIFFETQQNKPAMVTIEQTILLIACLFVSKFIADITASFSIEIVAQRIKRDTRDELYRNLLKKQLSFHNRQQVGDIMARAVNDARLIDYMFNPGIAFAFNAFIAIVAPIILIAFFRVELLIAPIIFLAMFWFTLQYYIKILHPVTIELRQQFGLISAGLTETIAGMDVVKWSAQEQAEQKKFARNTERYRDIFAKRGKRQALYLPNLCLGVATTIGAIHALYLMSIQQITLGDVVTYLGWLGLFQFPATISESSILVIQEGYVGAERMLHLIKEEIEDMEGESGQRRVMNGRVIFENVSFAYGAKTTLKNISFHIDPGQVVAIVGPTGSGKTTLTKLINRTYNAHSGRISIDGIEVHEWNLKSLRSQIGNVEQDVFLFSKSIAENIAFGSVEGADQGTIEAAARRAQLHEFIMGLKDGYASVIGERGTTLSGGQRQRLAIARALLIDPKILILDDSTSAVDSNTEEKIQKAIQEVMKGRTTFLITHRLSQIRQADKILVMNDGEIIDQGTHDELLRRCPLYHRIYLHSKDVADRKMNIV